jgi:hypothetical protein
MHSLVGWLLVTLNAWLKPMAPFVRGLIGRARSYALYEAWQRAMGYPDLMELCEQQVGRRPNLKDPLTFGEKLTWLKLHDKNPMLPIITNKVTAREWIAERVGSDKLVPLVGVFKSASDIDVDQLPRQFIAKINIGSGRNLIVRDKNVEDWATFRRTLDGWLCDPQMYTLMEWYHHQHGARIVVELLMVDDDGRIPDDYKFFTFHGKVQIIYCVRDRFTNKTVTIYRPDWKFVPVNVEDRPNDHSPPPPLLDHMIEIAERLAQGFPFMRVDTYCHAGKLYVGELTPHPNSGMFRANPPSFDLELGGYLDLGQFRSSSRQRHPSRPS